MKRRIVVGISATGILLALLVLVVDRVLLNGEGAGCTTMLMHSFAFENIPLAPNCSLTRDTPDADNQLRQNLEYWTAGLSRRRWIVCDQPPKGAVFQAVADERWMPLYMETGYQYRRTVIRGAFNRDRVPDRRYLAGAVGLVPWIRYMGQVTGQCNEKFSVWK